VHTDSNAWRVVSRMAEHSKLDLRFQIRVSIHSMQTEFD
jgi:hypothetical protein